MINATSSTTIIDDDAQEVPFEMIEIPAGDYTHGEGDTIKTIDYDYEIMKYPVTDYDYVVFMMSLFNSDTECVDQGLTVNDNYPWGDVQDKYRYYFENIIHVVRNPFEAIPESIFDL